MAWAISFVAATANAQDSSLPAKRGAPLAPEESRLSTAVFRAGLQKRGLTELLELHLRDYPPADRTEELLMRRDISVAQAEDPTRSEDQRRMDLVEANRILEDLIAEANGDPRRFTWQFELARSLLYDQAEPAITQLLYYGHCGRDAERLTTITTKALGALTDLQRELAEELARIDELSIRQFERLEKQGYVRELESLAQRAAYLKLWALYYDALPRQDNDPARAERLNLIAEQLGADETFLTTPHATSHVQVQSLLLDGMTHRLLNDHRTAREHFQRAEEVARAITDEDERLRIDWAVALVWLESIRNETQDGRFAEAVRMLRRPPQTLGHDNQRGRNLRAAAALLERWVYRRRAVAAARGGNLSESDQYRQAAWQAIESAARRNADLRDMLYAALYQSLGPDADPAGLDPIEQCALIAGLLSDAGEAQPEAAQQLLQRAAAVGERFLEEVTTPPAASLRPEVLYNLGVAEYRRGRLAAAADRFYEVASKHPTFENAFRAAAFAVQLAADLQGNASQTGDTAIRQRYRDALSLLLTHWRETDAARYWRFYYAQLLDELGEHEEAAAQYGLVDAAHEQFLQSLFRRARCFALMIQKEAAKQRTDRAELMRTVDTFYDARRRFTSVAQERLARAKNSAATASIQRLLGEMRLLAAEVQVLPAVNQPLAALEALDRFEEVMSETKAMAGRVWRVRLLAYEKLGRLDAATETIPIYLAADPENAPAVLQSLYDSLYNGLAPVVVTPDGTQDRQKAAMALVVAQQLYDWHRRQQSEPATPTTADGHPDHYVVQLAEANLRAGRFDRARELLDPWYADQKNDNPLDRLNVRGEYAYAEAMFQLDEYAAALHHFNRLASALPPTHPLRWHSLLRDLQCRTSLDHPAQGIIQVILQQKELYPDMGGPAMAGEFDKLLRLNQRRRDGGA